MFGENYWSWAGQNALDNDAIMIDFIWQGAAKRDLTIKSFCLCIC